MTQHLTPAVVARLTDRQLFATLHGRLSTIEHESRSIRGRSLIFSSAHEAQLIVAELKLRGTQLSLAGESAPFPRSLPTVATARLLPPRA